MIKLREVLIIWVAKKWKGGLIDICCITQNAALYVSLLQNLFSLNTLGINANNF